MPEYADEADAEANLLLQQVTLENFDRVRDLLPDFLYLQGERIHIDNYLDRRMFGSAMIKALREPKGPQPGKDRQLPILRDKLARFRLEMVFGGSTP